MNYSRQELIEKIKNKDVKFFEEVYHEGHYKYKDKVEVVYDHNNGDGREWFVALHFIEANLDILMEGYYSSQGDSEFEKVSIAAPYEFKEIRYKALTKEEMRDLNIEKVIE